MFLDCIWKAILCEARMNVSKCIFIDCQIVFGMTFWNYYSISVLRLLHSSLKLSKSSSFFTCWNSFSLNYIKSTFFRIKFKRHRRLLGTQPLWLDVHLFTNSNHQFDATSINHGFDFPILLFRSPFLEGSMNFPILKFQVWSHTSSIHKDFQCMRTFPFLNSKEVFSVFFLKLLEVFWLFQCL